jgi:hypothetical protein
MESHGFQAMQFLSKGIKGTGRYYSYNILSEIAALWDVGSHRKIIVHANKAGPHVAKYVRGYLDHNPLKRAPHPPDSPDLAPSDFYLFGHVSHQLQGHELTEGAQFVSAISDIFDQIPKDTLVLVLTTG